MPSTRDPRLVIEQLRQLVEAWEVEERIALGRCFWSLVSGQNENRFNWLSSIASSDRWASAKNAV